MVQWEARRAVRVIDAASVRHDVTSAAVPAGTSNAALAKAREALRGAAGGLATLAAGRRLRSESAEAHACDSAADIDRVIARSLGIVGQEGAGKSTLVNAIFGLNLVPTDADQPGTAAPIIIRADSTRPLAFSLMCAGDRARRPCANRQEFQSYFLQASNPDNVKRVRAGHIDVPSPHLADGLAIIDLPGLEGVSDEVRHEAIEALHLADGALVVVNDRAAGSAMRAIERLMGIGREIDGVLVNLRSSKLFDSQLVPLADSEVEGHITGTKTFIAARLAKVGANVPPERLFAVHLPSMHELGLAPGSKLGAPAHLDEITRFADWFVHAYGHQGAGMRLSLALDDAERLARALGGPLEADTNLIAGLLRGDPSVKAVASSRIETHRSELPGLWRAASRPALEEAGQGAWLVVEGGIDRLKATLGQLTREAQRSIPGSWWYATPQISNDIAANLNAGVQKASQALRSTIGGALRSYLGACLGAAGKVALAEVALLPIEHPPVAGANVEACGLWTPPYFESSDHTFAAFLDSRVTMKRLIREIGEAELLIDGSCGGPLQQAFTRELRRAQGAQLGIMFARLDALEDLVSSGSGRLLEEAAQRLESQSVQLAHARQQLAVARAALSDLVRLEQKRLARVRAEHQAVLLQRAEALAQADSARRAALTAAEVSAEPPRQTPPVASGQTVARVSIWKSLKRLLRVGG